MRYIVPKGFIAVDGTSLTVCEVDNEECWFTFMLVAYTQASERLFAGVFFAQLLVQLSFGRVCPPRSVVEQRLTRLKNSHVAQPRVGDDVPRGKRWSPGVVAVIHMHVAISSISSDTYLPSGYYSPAAVRCVMNAAVPKRPRANCTARRSIAHISL